METNTIINTKGLEDLPEAAVELLAKVSHPLIIFEGELGAGKTTFIKELLKQLGSKDAGSSPSYSLINEYSTHSGKKIYHLDLYRLQSAEEAFALGLEDILYSGQYCLIEWPQIISAYLEPPFHRIQIEITENGFRQINLSSIS